eukprot:gene6652-4795_t
MLESEATDLAITLAVGIPSLLAVLLDDFLSSIISGNRCVTFFEAFSTPVDGRRLRFPLPYIPIILQFLQENDGVALFESLQRSADTVESGRDWELVVTFSIYLRSLASKHCKRYKRPVVEEPLRGPFDIATEGVEDVRVTTIPAEVADVARAVQFIQETTQQAKTIYIFQLAHSKFPVFDGFVSYRRLKRWSGEGEFPTIHGYQCKLSRDDPLHPVDHPNIARGWFLRGGRTVKAPDRDGWVFPTEEDMNTNLLGFGLQLLHPVTWGSLTL